MFRALLCSSSGGLIVYMRHLVPDIVPLLGRPFGTELKRYTVNKPFKQFYNVFQCDLVITKHVSTHEAMPQVRQLVITFSQQRPGLNPRAVHTVFYLDKMVLGQDSLLLLKLSAISIITLKDHTHIHACTVDPIKTS